MADCVFCKIASGEIPSTMVYEDDTVAAFKDLDPQAPVHVLIIPKDHVESAALLGDGDRDLVAHVFCDVVPRLSEELALDKGFRVVTNVGEEGGQTVKHLHFHLLGGRTMKWPPG